MRYTKTEWLHDHDGEFPNICYSAFDKEGYEVQRIEIFASGKKLYADTTNQEGVDETWLYDVTIEDVLYCDYKNEEDRFITVEITQQDFDCLWQHPNNPKFTQLTTKLD